MLLGGGGGGGDSEHCSGRKKRGLEFGLNIFYFLNKYDNIGIHCNLQITGSEQQQEYYIGPLLVNIVPLLTWTGIY